MVEALRRRGATVEVRGDKVPLPFPSPLSFVLSPFSTAPTAVLSQEVDVDYVTGQSAACVVFSEDEVVLHQRTTITPRLSACTK